MNRMWSRETAEYLIERFRQCEHLYDPKQPDYNNRTKREQTYEALAGEIQKLFRMSVTGKEVRIKLNSLRSQFSGEYSKVLLQSNPDGDEESSGYRPMAWWYGPLSFLEKFVFPRNCSPITSQQKAPGVDVWVVQSDSQSETRGNYVEADSAHSEGPVYKDDSYSMAGRKRQSTEIDCEACACKRPSAHETEYISPPKEEDPIDIFGKFLIGELRTITDPNILAATKRKLQMVIIKAQEFQGT